MKEKSLLIASTLAVIFLTLLASGLSDLRLKPAQPMILNNGEVVNPVQNSLAEVGKRFDETAIEKRILLVGTFFLAVILAFFFMPAEFRKKLLKRIFKLGLFGIALLYFFDDFKLEREDMMTEETIPSLYVFGEAGEMSGIVPEVFHPQEVPQIWHYLIALMIVAALGALIWWIWRVYQKAQQEEEIAFKKISRIAKASLDDLEKGAEWEDVIIHSYIKMGEVIDERRGIRRQNAITPQEFSAQLISAGLPEKPVQRLTQLFELARYSTHRADEDEIEESVACLDEIASAFGEKL